VLTTLTDRVTVRDLLADIVFVDARRASAIERKAAMPRTTAAFWARCQRAAGRLDLRALRRLPELVPVGGARRSRDDEVAGAFEAALASGRLLAIARPPRSIATVHDETEPQVLGPAPSEIADVEFEFRYTDGTAVKGLAYELTDSGGHKTRDELPADGAVARKNVAGTYACALREVDLVDWERRRVRAGDEVRIYVRTSGIADGAQGTLRVYRLYDEDPTVALATVPIAIEGGRAEAAWRYRPQSADEAGIAAFVAEVSFEGGKVWKKSDPLEVELPDAVAAEWSAPQAAPGEDVELVVRTLGFADKAELSVTLFRHRLEADDAKLGDVAAPPLEGRATRVAIHCGGAALPAQMGDVYALVTVKQAGVERTARSPLLWVAPA
jgi:hypothetical protein